MNGPWNNLLLASGLHAIDYVVVAIYLGAVLATGWLFSKDQTASEDYFLGGRRMPWLAVGLSIVATMLSTVTYLAAPGELIQHGLAMSIGWLALPFAFLIVNFLWIPFVMRLRAVSIYEYLEKRFGSRARWTAVFLFVFVLRLFWMATIVLTASRAVGQITHASFTSMISREMSLDTWTNIVLLSVGIMATSYTMLGGIKAVIWTDVAQFIALFGGLVLTLIFVAVRTGTTPIDWWQTTTGAQGAGHEWPQLASWDITTRNTVLFTILSTVFWYSLTFIGDQVAVQRYLTTSDPASARRGNVVNFVADFVVGILLAICGMALLTYYLDPEFQTEIVKGITDPRNKDAADKVFPHFIEHGLPIGVSGLVVAALFAVAMSSLDSGMNSVSAVLTIDVLRRRRPDIEPAQELRWAKMATMVIGIACTGLALGMSFIPEQYNIIGITARTFNCALGPLGAMFIVGMFLPHVGQRAVVCATWIGFATAVVIAWWSQLWGVWGVTMSPISPFLITPIAAVATFSLAAVLGRVFRDEPAAGSGLSWTAVVRENKSLEDFK